MIIDYNYLLNFGFDISDEISEQKLNRAIKIAENYIIKPRLGYELYMDIIDDPTQYETVLNGGVLADEDRATYVSGLKEAEANLAYGILLRLNVNATTFGSVQKKDDYSSNADESTLMEVGMMVTEIGLAYLKEITDWYKIDNTDKALPNYWEEFI